MDASTSRDASRTGPTFGLEGDITTLGALRQRMAPVLQPAQLENSSSAAGTQGEPPLVFVTSLLDIHPRQCDQRFWQSTTWQQSVRGLDTCYFGWAMTNNCVLRLLYQKRWPGEKLPFLGATVSVLLLLSLLQSYGAYRSHPLYHQARPALVALNRVVRLAGAVQMVMAFRGCFLDGSCIAAMRQETSRSSLSPTVSFLRTMLLLSMTYPTIIFTAYLRFQFRTQLLFQIAHLALIVVCSSAGAAHVLNEPHITAPASSICRVVDGTSSFVIAHAAGIPPAPTSVCDTQLAPWLLVVLTQFSLGFLLPLCITYWFERRTKFSFLFKELRLRQFGPCSAWTTACGVAACALLMLCYSVVAWLLLLQHHRSLLRWVLPWDWPGAHSGWYHELLGS